MITTPLIEGEIQFSFLPGGSVLASKGGSLLASAEAGSNFDAPALVRWEYNSREFRTSPFPRHHIQVQAKVESFAGGVLDLNKIHLPSGWITVEEVVRFLITELKVKPFSDDWDDLLQKSEEKFREWTRRSI
jgi:hypothetical protein